MEYGTTAAQVAAEAFTALQLLKKACSSGNQKRAQPALRCYRNCGGTRHNT